MLLKINSSFAYIVKSFIQSWLQEHIGNEAL